MTMNTQQMKRETSNFLNVEVQRKARKLTFFCAILQNLLICERQNSNKIKQQQQQQQEQIQIPKKIILTQSKMVNINTQQLKMETSNFLNEEVLSVGLFEIIMAKEVEESDRAATARDNDSKSTNGGLVFPSFALANCLYLQAHPKSTPTLVCAATTTKMYLLDFEPDTSDWHIVAEFDHQ